MCGSYLQKLSLLLVEADDVEVIMTINIHSLISQGLQHQESSNDLGNEQSKDSRNKNQIEMFKILGGDRGLMR